MKFFVPNVTWSVSMALTTLRCLGFWLPTHLSGIRRILANFYTGCSIVYIVGFYIYIQAMELLYVWGDISLMTSAAFMLFTNMALCLKMINVLWRREQIQTMVDEADEEMRAENKKSGHAIVKSTDRETSYFLYFYIFLSMATVFGLVASVDKKSLPLRARYPYDTTRSPAFELTYVHQVSEFLSSYHDNLMTIDYRSTALIIAAIVNMSLDTLATSLIAQNCCRLRLLAFSLKTLCQDLKSSKQLVLSPEQDVVAIHRLRSCLAHHQTVLSMAVRIQNNFSEPIFMQFTVSSFIICVTMYQLAFEVKNLVRLLSMLMYLGAMLLQVFLYCRQGNDLTVQSAEISTAAYQCPWDACSIRFRRHLLLLMSRSVRVTQIIAGRITPLTLDAFTSIIKASYTFFTVLQSVQD